MKLKRRRLRPRLGGAVYVLPNLLTTGNLFAGFFSMMLALQERFLWAAVAILAAGIFDVLDGRVARLTGGTSEFGVQYDSLCDLISFGMAPAFLMYMFGLQDYGRLGVVICFLFLACGALRLARFNVQSSIGQSQGDFTGLPIPMAAAYVACFVAAATGIEGILAEVPMYLRFLLVIFYNEVAQLSFLLVSAIALALLMVSNIAYRSHKTIRVSVIRPFQFLVLLVLVAAVVAYQPELLGFALIFFYVVSGPLEWVLGWKKAVSDDEIFMPIGVDESVMEPEDKENHGSGVEKDEY